MRPQAPHFRIGNSRRHSRSRAGFRTNVQASALAGAAALVMALGVAAPAAQAASPTDAQYCDGGGKSGSDCNDPLGTSSGGAHPPSTVAATQTQDPGLGGQVGQLPFTGWDLFSLVAIALSLVGGGLVLARISSSRGRRT
jgi:hypothetical protein